MVMKGRGAAAHSSSASRMRKMGKMDKGMMTRLRERRKGREKGKVGLAQVGGRAMQYIEADGGLMGSLPLPEDWVKTADVQWLGKEGKWHGRRLILAKHMLIMTHLNETSIKDQIPLVEIESIEGAPDAEGAEEMSPMQKAAVYNSGNSLHTSIESIEKDVLEEAEEVLGLGDKGDPNTTHEGRTDSDSAKTSPMRVPEPASRAPSNSSIPFIRGLSQSLLTAQKGASSRNVERARSGKVLVGPAQMQDIVLGEVNRLQVFQVHTEQDGYNFGRTYIFQAETVEESDEWQRVIKNAWHAAVVEASNLSRFGALRLRVEIFSGSNIFQGMMALLIVGNFIINVIQAELKYEPGSYWDTLLAQIEIVLTVVFIVELGLNLFANWFSRFVNDGWSVFDFIVVSLSVISLIMDDASDVNVLRLLRPLRVVRLLGRLRSLRLIINACTRSLIPVSNAFLVTFLITAIYSILGVSFFDRLAPEFFGRFSLALFTMFQIATGDAWASEVSRVMMRRKEMCLVQIEQGMFEDELECWIESWDKEGTAWSQNDSTELVTRGNIDPIIVLFFSSFVIVVGLTLLNVVVAVLLDNFTAATETEKEDMQQKSINEQAKPLVEHPLDPLLAKLVLHDSSEELSSGIAVLFRTFDTSLNGTISREELSEGLRKLKTEQTIHLSEGDFESMTVGLLDDEGELEAVAFELMLRRELSNFIQRHMARQIELSGFHGRQDPTVLFALKKLMLSVDEKLYKTVTKVTTLAHAGDMESYKKSLPMSMPQPWKEEVGGSMVSKVASLEERTRRIEDALRLQTGHMEALMRKLDVPLPNNQKRRFIGESPNARAASLPTPSDSSPRMEPLRGDLEVAVGEPANEPGWKESLKTAKLSTNDSEKDVTANGGTSANGVGK